MPLRQPLMPSRQSIMPQIIWKNEKMHKSAPNETFELSDQWKMTV